MHHDASLDALSTNFIKDHMQRTSMGGQKALFCGKFMAACGAREHGHDSKQRHQVEGPIMQAKEWTRKFWAVQLVEHADTKVTKGR
jgi:hypothetical protein